MPDAVLVIDTRVVIGANEAARRMLAGGAELLGCDVAELIAPSEQTRIELIDEQRTRGWPQPARCRLSLTRTDGSPLMADVCWSRLDHMRILTVRDITDATRAEALMSRLAQLPTNFDGGVALLEAAEGVFLALGWVLAWTEFVEGGTILQKLIGPPADPVTEYAATLLGKKIPLEETPVYAEVFRRGEAIFLDNLPSSMKGPMATAAALSDSMERARVVRSVWCPIRRGDVVTHVLCVTGRDMTEHDFVAMQLFAAQVGAAQSLGELRSELVRRERLAAVGEMSAVLAHEVRNPIGIMYNALGSLERWSRDARPEHRALLDILRQEADRLKRLVTDLLDFASHYAPRLEPTVLLPVMDEAILAARYDPSFKDAEPSLDVHVAEDLVVRTDATLLRRAVLNMVLNAIQHSSRGGRVAVTAWRRRKGEIVIGVWNDGPPIPDEIKKRMFEPFYTTKPTGTGLGLAIVRRIAADLRAQIELIPVDRGVLFELVIPEAPTGVGPEVDEKAATSN